MQPATTVDREFGDENPEPGRRPVSLGLSAVVAAACVVLGLAWAISSPVGSSPDDDYHMASIWCPPPAESSGCKTQRTESGLSVLVPAPVALSANCFAFKQEISGSCTTDISDTKTEWTTRVDVGGYPGPYYKAAHLLVGPDAEASVLRIRLVNTGLALALLGSLCVLAGSRLRRVFGTTIVLSYVPLGLFITASINPSSWGLTGTMAAWMGLLVMFTTAGSRTRAAAAVLSLLGAGMAAVSRADAGLFAAVLAAAVSVLCWRSLRQRPWQVIVPLLMCLMGATTFLSSGQSGVISAGFTNHNQGDGWGARYTNLTNLPSLYAGSFGTWGLGWFDTPLPAVTSVFMIGALGMLITIALPRMDRVHAVVLAALLAIMTALPLYLLQQSRNLVGNNIQPRYLLPLLTFAMGMLVLAAMSGTGEWANRRIRFALVIAASLAQAGALNAEIRRYVVGMESLAFDLDKVTEWWWPGWPSPMTTWIAGSVAFLVLAVAAVVPRRSRTARRIDAGPGDQELVHAKATGAAGPEPS